MPQLNTLWYVQFPPVDSDSFAFISLVSWIANQLGTSYPKLVQDHYANSQVLAPAQLLFTSPDHTKTQEVDAVLTFENPDTTLLLLEQIFSLPVTNAHYVAPQPPSPPVPQPPAPTNLIGPAIEGHSGWFYPVPGDNSPNGTQFSQNGHTYIKQVVASVVGSSAYWFQLC